MLTNFFAVALTAILAAPVAAENIRTRALTVCGKFDQCYLEDRHGQQTPLVPGGSLNYEPDYGYQIVCDVEEGVNSGFVNGDQGTWINLMTCYDGVQANAPRYGDYDLPRLARDWGARWECGAREMQDKFKTCQTFSVTVVSSIWHDEENCGSMVYTFECPEEPSCGDGNVDEGETCDPPGSGSGYSKCRYDCTFCGDGMKNGNEECDYNERTDSPDYVEGCRTKCMKPKCGDGILGNTPGETCENPGSFTSSGKICRDDCSYCGDGVLDTDKGEECDPKIMSGEGFSPGCSGYCKIEPFCGDGELNNGETCDFKAGPGSPGFSKCRADGEFPCTFCGDGVIQFPGEACDPGITNPNQQGFIERCTSDCQEPDPSCEDVSTATCTDAMGGMGSLMFRDNCRSFGSGPDECTYCGDNVVQASAGEECEPPNTATCDSMCKDVCPEPTPCVCSADGGKSKKGKGGKSKKGGSDPACDSLVPLFEVYRNNDVCERQCVPLADIGGFLDQGYSCDPICTPPEDPCDVCGKPQYLRFKFSDIPCTGPGCNTQDKAVVEGAQPFSGSVSWSAGGDDSCNGEYGSATVTNGQDLTLRVPDNEDKFETNTVICVGSSTVTFHTSCSSDIIPGDKFGNIQLVGYSNARSGAPGTCGFGLNF